MKLSRYPGSVSLFNGPVCDGGNQCSSRYGDDPGPNDAARHTPFNRRHPARGADADDSAGDRVGCADWNSTPGGTDNANGARCFRAKASNRPKRRYSLAHCADDSPTARERTQTYGRMRHQNNPKRNIERLDITSSEQHAGDDAHRFLRVVGSVAETEQGSGKKLQAPEILVNMRRFRSAKNPLRHRHQKGAKHHADNRRKEDK